MGKSYDRLHLALMNVGARIFGGGMVLVGLAFLGTAAFDSSDRALMVVVGVVGILIGVAFLMVKPTTTADLDSIRTLGRDPKVRFRYEKGHQDGPNKSLGRTREG